MHQLLSSLLVTMYLPFTLFAQDENPFPNVIVPQDLKFTFISNSAKDSLLHGNIIDSAKDEETNAFVYLYSTGDNISVVIRCFNGWLIPEKEIGLMDNHQGGGIRLVNLDDTGTKEILIWNNYTFSHNNNEGGNNESYNNYVLINTDKQQLICSGTFAYDEMIWSDNEPASNEKNDKVSRDKKDLSYNYFTFKYDIKVSPGKLVFDNIYYYANAPQYPDEERYRQYMLDTVSAIAYKVIDGKLVKQQILPQCRNTAPPDGYKVLRGKIDKYPITMHLVKFGNEYEGYYYYNNQRRQIQLYNDRHTDSSAPVVLTEGGKNPAFFRGGFNGNNFTGKWTDSKKTYDFNLSEIHEPSNAPLIPYSFSDCYFSDDSSNTYCVRFNFFLPDKNRMREDNWEKLNQALKQISDIYCESDINLPATMFQIFRAETIGQASDDMFPAKEDGNNDNIPFYTELEEKVLYNDNGILCISNYRDEYTGGAHPNHNYLYLLYDLEAAKTIGTQDVFNCSDSTLYDLIKEQVTTDNPGDTNRLSYFLQTSQNMPGVFYIIPGYFMFYYKETEIVAAIPFDKLKQYLKPGYLKRLR